MPYEPNFRMPMYQAQHVGTNRAPTRRFGDSLAAAGNALNQFPEDERLLTSERILTAQQFNSLFGVNGSSSLQAHRLDQVPQGRYTEFAEPSSQTTAPTLADDLCSELMVLVHLYGEGDLTDEAFVSDVWEALAKYSPDAPDDPEPIPVKSMWARLQEEEESV